MNIDDWRLSYNKILYLDIIFLLMALYYGLLGLLIIFFLYIYRNLRLKKKRIFYEYSVGLISWSIFRFVDPGTLRMISKWTCYLIYRITFSLHLSWNSYIWNIRHFVFFSIVVMSFYYFFFLSYIRYAIVPKYWRIWVGKFS